MKTEYKLIVCYTNELMKQVNKALEEGWELYGTPFATKDYVCQAMLKTIYRDTSPLSMLPR